MYRSSKSRLDITIQTEKIYWQSYLSKKKDILTKLNANPCSIEENIQLFFNKPSPKLPNLCSNEVVQEFTAYSCWLWRAQCNKTCITNQEKLQAFKKFKRKKTLHSQIWCRRAIFGATLQKEGKHTDPFIYFFLLSEIKT